MNIKLDENMPAALVDALSVFGHEVHTVAEEDLGGAADEVLWDRCRTEGRFLITQDLDFSDIRRFEPGTHAGILLVRLGQPGRRSLFERVQRLFEEEQVGQWPGCFVVATDRKLRVRRP